MPGLSRNVSDLHPGHQEGHRNAQQDTVGQFVHSLWFLQCIQLHRPGDQIQ